MVALATCSYYEFRPEMGQPTRISLGIPKFHLDWVLPNKCLIELAPRGHYFHDPPVLFGRKYIDQLVRYGTTRILSLFEEFDQGEGPLVLLCFERDVRTRDDCHRRRFADWWFEQTGEYVPELGGRYAAAEFGGIAEPEQVKEPPERTLW